MLFKNNLKQSSVLSNIILETRNKNTIRLLRKTFDNIYLIFVSAVIIEHTNKQRLSKLTLPFGLAKVE